MPPRRPRRQRPRGGDGSRARERAPKWPRPAPGSLSFPSESPSRMPRLIIIIIGSTRRGRSGLPIAEWFAERARSHGGFDVNVIDLAELELPLLDEPKHPRLRQSIRELTLTGTLHIRGQALPIKTPVSVATLGRAAHRRGLRGRPRASGLDFKGVGIVRVQAARTLQRRRDALDPNGILLAGKHGSWPSALIWGGVCQAAGVSWRVGAGVLGCGSGCGWRPSARALQADMRGLATS